MRALGKGKERRPFAIVEGASGVLKPGMFTLLLGPPGQRKVHLLADPGRPQPQDPRAQGARRACFAPSPCQQKKHAGSQLASPASGNTALPPLPHPVLCLLQVWAEELSYNGRGLGEFVVERTAAYIGQTDLHYGELTVHETQEFSARVQSTGFKRGEEGGAAGSVAQAAGTASRIHGGINPGMLGVPLPVCRLMCDHHGAPPAPLPPRAVALEEVLRREAELGVTPDPQVDAYMRGSAFAKGKGNLIVATVIRLLGLDVCADTAVGTPMLRGISGGQKKRVTTGEMAVGPVKAIFADEISTGLDSNTTYTIARALRNLAHVMDATIVVGLLQPAPETFELFDDVILLASGKVIGSVGSPGQNMRLPSLIQSALISLHRPMHC